MISIRLEWQSRQKVQRRRVEGEEEAEDEQVCSGVTLPKYYIVLYQASRGHRVHGICAVLIAS